MAVEQIEQTLTMCFSLIGFGMHVPWAAPPGMARSCDSDNDQIGIVEPETEPIIPNTNPGMLFSYWK